MRGDERWQCADLGIRRHAWFALNAARDRAFAEALGAGENPAEDRFVIPTRGLRMRQAEQVAMRPTIALLILHDLAGQVVGLAADIPAAHGVAQTAAPTAQGINILREVEQVRADPADLAEVLESQCLGFGAAVCGHQCEGKDGRIILRRATAVADLDDAVHGAHAVRLNAADEGVVVLLHEIRLTDVIGSALGAEDQEAVEAGPVIDLPVIASGGVAHLGRAGDRLRLRRDAAVEQFGLVEGHDGLLSCAVPPTPGTVWFGR